MIIRTGFGLFGSVSMLLLWSNVFAAVWSPVSAAQQHVPIFVSSGPELMLTLARAGGGETILLRPGDYGDLVLDGQRGALPKYSAPVRIRSADPKHMASFRSVRLVGAENLAFEYVKFDYVAKVGVADFERPFNIIGGSRNISIIDSVFDGDFAQGRGDSTDGYATGYGLTATDAANIVVRHNKFFNWSRAGVFGSIQNLNIIGNDVYNNRSDGFNFADVQHVLIEGNHFHDFKVATGSDDHPDMIQFWTSGTTNPSTNIVIRGNIINSAGGIWSQSIFMRNEMVDTNRAGDEMFYRNIIIEDNVIHNGHAHGISVGETHGLIIRNNTLLQNKAAGVDDKLVHIPRIIVSARSTDVLVADNIVTMVIDPKQTIAASANATVKNNLIAQRDRPGELNYYGSLFVNALADADATLADLTALPGSLVEKMGVGSRFTRFTDHPDSPTGFILHLPGFALSSLRHHFNVRNLFGPKGRIDTEGASVAWNFGDGSTGGGLATTHTYARAGKYVVKADVTLPDGRVFHLNRTIMVVWPDTGNKPPR